MKTGRSIQYTLRGVPPRADLLLREKAAREKKSLNQAALETLTDGLGLSANPPRHDDLDDLAGTWVKSPGFDLLLKEMDRVDKDIWT